MPESETVTGQQAGRRPWANRGTSDEGGQIFKALRPVAFFGFLTVLVAVPFLTSDLYLLGIVTQGVVYACLALGLNVVIGLAGLLDLGYAAFLAFGAYAWAVGSVTYHLNIWQAAPVVLGISILGGLVVAIPTLRLRGDYLAIVTLAFGVMVEITANNLSLTGGPTGIYGIPPLSFGSFVLATPERIYMALVVTLLVFTVFSWCLRRSALGLRMLALREDEDAASSLGVRPYRTKTYAYLIGGVLAAIVGVQYASLLSAISPNSFSVNLSVYILLAVILGGEGGVIGPVVGGFIVALVPEVLRDYENYRYLIFGILIVFLVRKRPEGLFPPSSASWLAGRSRRGAAHPRPGVPSVRDAADSPPSPSLSGSSSLGLVVRDLSVIYGGVHAVNGVSFELTEEGATVLGIIGPNGAGKTSLFNAITGFTAASSGDVHIDGTNMTGAPPHRMSESGVRRTFQNLRLFPNVSVEDNIRIGAGRKVSDSEILSSLELVGLAPRMLSMKPPELAYGQQKRLELARALANRPRILMLDEPAAGLNDGEKAEIGGIIRQVVASGTHCVVIDHDVELISSVSDRVLCLNFGKQIRAGTPAEVIGDAAVIEAYLGRRAV